MDQKKRYAWRFVGAMLGMAIWVSGIARGQDQPSQDLFIQFDEEPSTAAPVTTDRAARGPFGGAGMSGGMGGPGMGMPGYKATWYPSQPDSSSGEDFGLIRQNLSGAVPIWRDGADMLMLTAGVRNTLFFTDTILPDTQRPFPHELWNVSVGLMYLRTFDNNWSGGLSTTLGSASDKPFHSIHEMNISLLAFLQVPAKNERDAWLFSLMYSPMGNLTFPIPGVAYSWRPSDDLQVNFGIPFTINWKPTDALTLNLSYFPITNVNARATYEFAWGWHVYGGFEWLNEAYFLVDRAEQRDRFLAFEKRLIAGVRWDLAPHVSVDVNAGYAFDRYYGEGARQISDLHDRVDIGSGAFLGASLLARW